MKATHAEYMKRQMEGSRYIVMALLQWSHEQYCWYQYECGTLFLKEYLRFGGQFGGAHCDSGQIAMVEREAAYWGWWKLHWHLREQGMLGALTDCAEYGQMTKHRFRMVYKIINNPFELARPETEQGRILDESYSRVLVPMLRGLTPALSTGGEGGGM